jgi:hypothetical protein
MNSIRTNLSGYLFNNEAIGTIAIASVMKECTTLSYSKSMLILPFLFHQESTAFLKRSRVVLRSSEEFVIKKVGAFANFNDRYFSLLPISINSIMILSKTGTLSIKKNQISYNDNNDFNVLAENLGKRAGDIVKASKKLSTLLLSESEPSLYLKLRIQL